jgi:hypothetical protein
VLLRALNESFVVLGFYKLSFIQSSNNSQSLLTNLQVLDSLSKWKVVMLKVGYAKVGMLLNKREFLGLHQLRAQAL